MTATAVPTIATASTTTAGSTSTPTASSTARRTTSKSSLWRPGLLAAVGAAVATTAVAALAHAAGVSLETAPGKAIPVLAFGQLTLFFAVIGLVIASVIRRRAGHPRSTFLRTTIGLTALSVVPDLLASTAVATKLTLMLTHVVAAAIVIPAVAARLQENHSH